MAVSAPAQTTEGMITGLVFDRLSGDPIPNATIYYEQLETGRSSETTSNANGNYYIPLLSPGSYRVRVTGPSAKYQILETYGVLVTVAGYVQIDFDLRPLSDVWERNRYRSLIFRNNTVLPFYGPDIDPSYVGNFEPNKQTPGQLEPSISAVIDPAAIANLPLAGRDIYTSLVLQPGVTADSTTTRSLGLSANGQRPSASNFLLDGVEENDAVLGGPALRLAPEMVQEYRVSTNNFSAEYGRTAGYIANAVTRSAVTGWHGIVFGDLNNQVLNANTFQHNANRLPRNTLHQIEGGFSAGGTIPHSRLRSWTAFDRIGSRGFGDPVDYTLPTQSFAASLPAGSVAARLLQEHPPRQWADAKFGAMGPVSLRVPVTLQRITALERIDYAFSAKQNLAARIAGDFLKRPDFNWSPYAEAPFAQNNVGGVVSYTSTWSPTVVTAIRASFLNDSRRWDLALGDLPQIVGLGNLMLPGSCCQVDRISQGWRDRTRTSEVAGNLILNQGAHLLKLGTGLLDVRTATRFTFPPVSSFVFITPDDFAHDQPVLFQATLSRFALQQNQYQVPDTRREYRTDQVYGYAQEDWRVLKRLTVNAGLRYDRFPAPVNTGSTPDVLVNPGAGGTFADQIAAASVAEHRGALFTARPNNFSIRLALSWAISPDHGTTLRAGYGTFYDRPFQNFYLTASANDMAPKLYSDSSCPVAGFYRSGNYSATPSSCTPVSGSSTNFNLTLFQPELRSPRIHSFFLSLQQPIRQNLAVELNVVSSLSRNLLATDVLNRQTGLLPPANGLPNLDYRTNQGESNYNALSAAVRYRSGRVTFNAAYTWSHSTDNQSDPLLGEYFDFGFSNQTDRANQNYIGAFTLAGDARVDRGNSDFDQRQNFVGWFSAALPSPSSHTLKGVLSNWSVAGVFAVRSGLPYTVYAGVTNCFPVCNTRANLVNPSTSTAIPAVGGEKILNPAAFSPPADGTNGNLGRNAFTGPGFANLDFSLSRSFPLKVWREQCRVQIRADAFNLLNHANLQNPEGYLGEAGAVNPDFGVALYGSTAQKGGFPSSTPLIESSRQVHLLIRFQF